jgi:hypothetical protein
MKWLFIAGLLVALYGLHRLALWLEKKGWIYYMNKKASLNSLGTALLELQQMAQPEKGHLLEAKRKRQVQQECQGDPKEPGEDHSKNDSDL